ncbi:MAG: hypothetical protein RL040_902 [Bacteroidota bacterium]
MPRVAGGGWRPVPSREFGDSVPAASSFVRPSPVDRSRVAGARGAAGDADGKRAPVCTAGAVGGVATVVGAGVTDLTVVVW